MKTGGAVVLLLIASFCVFGFMAAGEPGPNHIYYRVGYPVIGIACLVVAAVLLWKK
jgi:hypothetical protein